MLNATVPHPDASVPNIWKKKTIRVDNGNVAMATDYTHVPAQASVSEVLRLVVLEHQELRAQYKQVSTRIRNLRMDVKTLRNLGGRSAGTPRREGHGDDSRNVESRADEIHLDAEPSGNSAVDSQGTELRRAIRIAVFETSGTISSEEVHARILGN